MSRVINVFDREMSSTSFLMVIGSIGGFIYLLFIVFGAVVTPFSAAMYAASVAQEFKTIDIQD